MNAPFDHSLSDALHPWDGRWYVPLPDPGLRFFSLEQFTAKQILRGRNGLTVADARLLQAIVTHDGPLSSLQRHWLRRLAREHDERMGEAA